MYYSLNKLGIGNYLVENYKVLRSGKQLFRLLNTGDRIDKIVSTAIYDRAESMVSWVHCGPGTGGQVWFLEVFNWKPPSGHVFSQRSSMISDSDSDSDSSYCHSPGVEAWSDDGGAGAGTH
jgi:hypothetical protein